MGFAKIPKVEGCMVADGEELGKAVESCPESVQYDLKKSLDIKDGGLTFLFVGQLVERKGIKELLSGWSEHINNFPGDAIIVAGQGVLGRDLQSIYRNEKSIKFVGQISYDHIAEYLAIADISVMPTLEDNWSLVVPEAMACSKPVATTPYNGCHVELIEEGKNGYLFDPLEKSSIVKMLAAFHNANLSDMGKRSKEIISNYTPLTAANRIFELCQKIKR